MTTPLTAADARRIDRTCDRFEAAWQTTGNPRVEDFLDGVGEPVRSVLFRQVLMLDWDYRRSRGEDPTGEEYRERFPEFTGVIVDAMRELATTSQSTYSESEGDGTPKPVDRDAAPIGFERIGPIGFERYEVLKELGRGGIGTVFQCRDTVLGRDVAVKFLRDPYRGKAHACRRFIREAHVGSRLQHPGIVPVYDLGYLPDGSPFLTMKLVGGHTLAALLRDRTTPADNLPRFLSVFEQVCQAMAYAHVRGVVHRDLKPSNVMVGAFGEVQVMDWGFAKVLGGDDPDDTGRNYSGPAAASDVTLSGAMLGTPAYMPPEQAAGTAATVDARADVFALGAILCEILTGAPAYVGTADEVFYLATAGDLRTAYTRLAACGVDPVLQDLTLRCLSGDRAARPPDAGAVAAEVTEFQRDTQRRLQSAQMERTASDARALTEKRSRRMTMALALALLVGASVASWQAVVATRARKAADGKEAEAKASLDFVVNRVIAAARPLGREGGLGFDIPLRVALDAAAARIAADFAGRPRVEARLRMTLADSYRYLGESQKALDQYARARDIYSQELGPDDTDTIHATMGLAAANEALDRQHEALELREGTLAQCRRVFGDDHRESLRAMHDLAESWARHGRTAEALSLDEEAVRRERAHLGTDDLDTVRGLSSLAFRYQECERYADALRLRQEALDILMAKFGPNHPDTLNMMGNVASSHNDLGGLIDKTRDRKEHEIALKLRLRVVDGLRRTLGPTHLDTNQSIYNLGNAYGFLMQYDEALKYHREALALRRAQLGPNHSRVLYSMWGVAFDLFRLDRGEEAVRLIDDVFDRAATLPVLPDLIALGNERQRYFERKKDAAGCRRTCELYERLKQTDPRSLFNCACYRAVTSRVFRQTDQSPDGIQAANDEADRAMDWLRKAIAAGYKKADQIENDSDLEALHDRKEFHELLLSVREKQSK